MIFICRETLHSHATSKLTARTVISPLNTVDMKLRSWWMRAQKYVPLCDTPRPTASTFRVQQ